MSRLLLLQHFLSGRRNGVRWSEMVRRLLRPSAALRARSRISRIVESGDFLRVYYRSLSYPLYWPKEISIRYLYQVTAEIMFPEDWHCYEWGPTPINAEDFVVDCGAAEGLFSLVAAGRCRRVYAVEPLPRFVQALRLTFAEHENVEIFPVALSSTTGTASFIKNGILSSIDPARSPEDESPISVTTLDDLFYRKQIPITYLKADLEGQELKMLEGARNTIAAYHPKIAITTYHDAEHARLISDYLRSIDPSFRIVVRGVDPTWGGPVMLHAYVD